ncbi:MAG TPA: aminotransferase class I/II-fold pyridoxal phosphate-dependent enzyme [Terriglobia bacterium]|nr:aminotransferase class I/II-fold pyridoxal phosphate-dependent enzyme [Terriglobia bacterium]HVB29212.1 aminotransferase class I/II-fold pyridoxal phosphate-dependent enzyme [Terriglobia bacterium]
MSPALPQPHEILAASRLDHVHYAIRDLAVLAEELTRQGKQILSLNIGDPGVFDFQTPPHLIEAAARAMRDGHNGYAPSLGEKTALEAIRAEAERKGIRNIQSVFVTEGVSEAVDICLTALLEPQENVLTPLPDYPLYDAILAKLGASTNPYRLDEANDWQPDVEQMESLITKSTRALVVINPNNPTGAVYSQATLEKIVDVARRHHLLIFADEIYAKLILDGEPHVSIASLAPDVPVVTFGGLSKEYLAPGWRVAWGIASGDPAVITPYVQGIHKLLRARLSANHPLQYAIPAALNGPQDHLQGTVDKMRRRRDLVLEWSRKTPRVSCVSPRGAFYAFPRLDIPESDESFVRGLLAEEHVLVVHGGGFGQAPGTRHIRIVFLPPEPILEPALNKMAAYLERHWA